MAFSMYTDGGARGNPGPSAFAAIIFDESEKLVGFDCKFSLEATNNQAEYSALLVGLKLAKKHGIKDLNCFLDSELVVKQIKGEYSIKSSEIIILKSKIDKELGSFDTISFTHVPREKNKFADKLVNITLDAAMEK